MPITITTGILPLAISEALSDKKLKTYIYLEYANSSGDIPVGYTTGANIPNFNNPMDYYLNIASTSNFLRVPALRSPILESTTTTTTSKTTTTYLAQSFPGVLPYRASPAFNTTSICYGAALVLVPESADITQDLVVARAYFVDATLLKTASSELFVTFPFTVNATKA